jgi:hypothetical protein
MNDVLTDKIKNVVVASKKTIDEIDTELKNVPRDK